ncbi:hypothetical protein NXY30_06270 [Bacteroides faecis]|uniref:Lipoprotein n=1 Tax=Bacteroides faecis TaxID=674529 RepID=A0ABY5THK2_9BACE|nr:hypothetical protein [Bacteroides faecis]UVQ75987.1 hypothetical protein NXY30_06270 [Bacteroides faecis]
MKYKLIIAVLYMIMSACNNTDSNEFAFSNYSWECPKEGGRKIFTSNKDEWKIDQLILDGIIIKEYSPEYIKDKNQSFPPDKFDFDFFLLKSMERK